MKLVKYILAIVLVYLYIYSPALQLMPFGIDKLVLVWAYVFLFISRGSAKYINLFTSDFKVLGIIVFISFFISVLRFRIGDLILYDIYLLIEFIPVSCALYILLEKTWYVCVKDMLFIASGVAGFITVYLLLHPEVALYVKSSILRVPDVVKTYFAFRGYGFTDGLLHSYPAAQGLMLGMLIIGFINLRILYFILAVPIFISVVVNARIGVLPIIFAVLLFFVYGVNKRKVLFYIIVVVALCFFMLKNMTLSGEVEKSIAWAASTIDLFSNFITGREVENMDALTGSMFFFPQDIIVWMIGTSYNVFGETYIEKNSDIGYIIRLFYGGVVYLFFILSYILSICKRLYYYDKPLGLLLFFTFIVYNYKTDFLCSAPCSRLFFIIYVFVVCSHYDRNFVTVETHDNNI